MTNHVRNLSRYSYSWDDPPLGRLSTDCCPCCWCWIECSGTGLAFANILVWTFFGLKGNSYISCRRRDWTIINVIITLDGPDDSHGRWNISIFVYLCISVFSSQNLFLSNYNRRRFGWFSIFYNFFIFLKILKILRRTKQSLKYKWR